MVTLGAVVVCDMFDVKHQYPAGSHAIGCWSDQFIPGLERMAKAIKSHGAVACAQLDLHYEWREDETKPFESVGPSKGPGGPFVKELRELTKEEIKAMVSQFGDAALRCKKAGYQVVEIHAGIGYMLCRFLSSYSNRRTDEYGGSIENRLRIVREVIADCQAKAGKDYPLIVRFNIDDYMPNGNTIADAEKIITILQEDGVACFNLQAGFHESTRPLVNQFVPEGPLVDMAAKLKNISKVPIITGYRISDITFAEKALAANKCDIIGMGRPFLADPSIVKKAISGHAEDIRPCISCCRCLDSTFVGRKLTCTMNAELASDLGLPENARTDNPKKIVIIGAGPSGMEAARVAAIRGHKVTILEKGRHLGGLLNLASVLNPFLENVITYYTGQMKKLPIDIRLKTEATPELLRKLKADHIIVAPGGDVIEPVVPGIKGKNVIGSQELKRLVAGVKPKPGFMWACAAIGTRFFGNNKGFMRWGMSLPWPIKKDVVIIGGQFAGCEVADSLMKGRNITIVDEGKKPADDLGIVTRGTELAILKENGVTFKMRTKVTEVTRNGLKVVNLDDGKEEFIPAKTIIPSLGATSNTELYDKLSKTLDNVHLIGDGSGNTVEAEPSVHDGRPAPNWEKARRLREAVKDGYEIGMTI